MKFILVITLCSFIENQCLSPIQIKAEYSSWKECAIAALKISKEIIIAQDDTFVNDNKVATQFTCKELKEI
jgi:hypothetical protein